MKKFQIKYSIIVAVLALGMTSCTDYLDKEADSTVSEETAFKNFHNFQGFVEEMYNCIPDKEKCYWCTTFNWGDDEIMNTGVGDSHFTRDVDLGNFRAWQTNNQIWLMRSGSNPTSGNKFDHSLWPHAWYCIRKANIGIANLDKMKAATQEEKDLIAGQLYFFRAWWYEELIQWFGGLPYLDHPIAATGEEMKYARLSYRDCAKKCAEDFRKAADLLPVDWDNTIVGGEQSGKNQLRVTKIAALGYLGKVLLWGASPLMKNGPQTGGTMTYDYDQDMAKQSAEAFAELLDIVENTSQSQISLAEFNYTKIYDHEAESSVKNNYSFIFYTTGAGWRMPGSSEAIFRGMSEDYNGSNWNFTKTWGTKIGSLVEHDNVIHQPTANYINYAYGMEDGTPAYIIENGKLVPNDAAHGGSFDPTHPFKNRDPRFYHDIVFDGFKYVLNPAKIQNDDLLREQEYCGLYTNGYTRSAADASRTGYYCQKLVPHQANKCDEMYNWNGNLHTYLPYMRLADIYLMYAEACAAIGNTYTPLTTAKANNYAKSAADAINKLRDRVGAGHMAEGLDNNKFMDEVRRERACELAFEGFRFNDLQRWLLLTEEPFTAKYSAEFDRVHDYDWYKTNDPKKAEVKNWHEKKILQRYFRARHYWFPLPEKDTYLYLEFEQNPGW